ncbi:MAG: hypothetical protein LYZ70_05925 [Nitrososphaerales archaeon]|nr:hypothetical protein [Nitrososphaerales archaeon]
MSTAVRRGPTITSAKLALSAVTDGSVIALSGFNMAVNPEYLILQLWRSYKATGHPRNVFLIAESLPAIPGRALDRVAKEVYNSGDGGLIRGISVPYFGFAPWLQKLVTENRLEAYSWPMGAAAYWFREVASGRPGLISKIGVDTSIDPRYGGGRLNEMAEKKNTCRVRRLVIDDGDYLIFEAPKPDVAFIRATTSDPVGNLTMEEEPMRGTVLSIAQATKAHPNPGIVVAQVKKVMRNGFADPKSVEVPGPFVDYIVVSPERYHWQSGSAAFDRRLLVGAPKRAPRPAAPREALPQHEVIAKRVLLELVERAKTGGKAVVVNLGIGIPAMISRLAFDEKLTEYIVTVIESGLWGGVALTGVDFGIALNPFAVSTMPDMFSNFEGGVIDAASLGFLQVGENGDVNPSMLPGRIYGPGGFPVIAGGSPRIYFAGAFTAGESKLVVKRGELQIIRDGGTKKFVREVYRSFFSGSQALLFKKQVLYVTERAVFTLTPGGLELTEVAPGVDIERDVVSKMEFRPRVSPKVVQMDERIFGGGTMRLADELR